jgi:MFS family permease
MKNYNKVQLGLLLSSSAVRTFTDSFATGLLFVISIKFAGEGVAALTSSVTLLLIFIFSPVFGSLIDKKIFSPGISGGLYILTGILMPLFLTDLNFILIFYLNLLFLVLFNIPAALYMSSWASLTFKGKPATGYSLLASTNTLFYILGTICGSYLVQNDIIWLWAFFKTISSIIVGITLVIIFRKVDTLIFTTNGKRRGSLKTSLSSVQIISTTNKGIFNSTTFNYRIIRNSVIKKISGMNKNVILFSICIIFFALSRTFFLTNVAFTIFAIFDRNLFLYTLVINTAALTAFIFFPFNGRIADFIGNWNYYAIGILATPLYLISFLIFTNDIILVFLWALPMGVITEVAQIGVISSLTRPEDRNSAIGIITSSGALGSVLGAFLLSIAVGNTSLMNLLIIITILIPIFILIPMLYIKKNIPTNYSQNEQ